MSDDEDYNWYELRAVYAMDHETGARIEQRVECTAPTDSDEAMLRQLVADATGRMVHSIEELEVISDSPREQVDSDWSRAGSIELGGI